MRLIHTIVRDQLSFIILRRGDYMQLMFFLKSDKLVVWRSRKIYLIYKLFGPIN